METVDGIEWIPSFGYERELDWLLNMSDWMISKKRYWGLALPIYDCPRCGTFDVVGGRDELRDRAVEGWDRFEGHTPHRPWIDAVKIACPGCGEPVQRIADVGNPWLDAGIVPFSTLHYRTDPDYWQRWFPADFITESFPGQFRNWFYSLLAMSTVLRREPPFRTIFGYALLYGEDGRPMHKSWGNFIAFDDAAERVGVDVMRWLYAKARPDDNIRFGWKPADEARRELLVLWNVFSFFVTYARLARWSPSTAWGESRAAGGSALDRWIRSRTAGLAADVRAALESYDARTAAERLSAHVDELSTWYLRRSRRRFQRGDDAADREAALGTLHGALLSATQVMAPTLPFLSERMWQVLATAVEGAPESVHLARWPDEALAGDRDASLEDAMATLLGAVELGRTLRGQSGLKVRQPLARAWLALPGGRLGDASEADAAELLALLSDELNVKSVELIGDESELVSRRVKALFPVLAKRGRGREIPQVTAALRDEDYALLPDGSVRAGSSVLAPDEVEILATPRPGTAVAHDEGLVVVIDTTLTDELRAEGDARELQRAVQDLRKQAELALDDRIELWLSADDGLAARIEPHLQGLAQGTLADAVHLGAPPEGTPTLVLDLDGTRATLALRRREPVRS
jgi:isoleucyl-tRNA synthetase